MIDTRNISCWGWNIFDTFGINFIVLPVELFFDGENFFTGEEYLFHIVSCNLRRRSFRTWTVRCLSALLWDRISVFCWLKHCKASFFLVRHGFRRSCSLIMLMFANVGVQSYGGPSKNHLIVKYCGVNAKFWLTILCHGKFPLFFFAPYAAKLQLHITVCFVSLFCLFKNVYIAHRHSKLKKEITICQYYCYIF